MEEVRNNSACNLALASIALSRLPADCSTAGRRCGYKELICPGTLSAFMAAFNCATACMAQHQQSANPQDCYRILKARDYFWCRDVSRNTCNKDVTDRLVKHQLHRYVESRRRPTLPQTVPAYQPYDLSESSDRARSTSIGWRRIVDYPRAVPEVQLPESDSTVHEAASGCHQISDRAATSKHRSGDCPEETVCGPIPERVSCVEIMVLLPVQVTSNKSSTSRNTRGHPCRLKTRAEKCLRLPCVPASDVLAPSRVSPWPGRQPFVLIEC